MAVWSIVKFSDLSDAFRLDAEYYQPTYLSFERETTRGEPLAALVNVIMHPIEITRVYSDTGLRILLAQNIRQNYLDLAAEAYMPIAVKPIIGRNFLKKGDVLMTRSGANFGDTACYLGDPAEIYACADCLIIRTAKVAPGYLSTFFNTKIGRGLLTRGAYGMAQPHIAPTYLRSLRIPRLGDLEEAIQGMIEQSNGLRHQSIATYQQAETALITAIGLDQMDLTPRLFYEDRFSTVNAASRFDAEYFNPRYAVLFDRLQRAGAVRLGDHLAEPIQRGISPVYDESGDYIVINSQHVGKTHVILDDNRRSNGKAVDNNGSKRGMVRKYDVLLNSTGYITIGRCQTFLDESEALVDNHVAIIRPKPPLDPVFLAFFLNAIPGQMQTERGWTGSSGQIELRAGVVSDYLVWNAPAETQHTIRLYVEESFAARQESRRLLDTAKHAVEIAIEDDEAAARKFLEGEGF